MSQPLKTVKIQVDGRTACQTIDGFGVNINSKYWDNGKLAPAVDLLLSDLGATLFRVDIYGKSNWLDPTGEKGPQVLSEKNYAEVYQGPVFRAGWDLMRYLNEKGIEPYLAASGDVSKWMLAEDGKSLAHYDQFCEMMVSIVKWAKEREQLRFKYFGPLNETDLGSPEGPTVSATDFVKVLEMLDEKLHRQGLDDIRLVAAEQSAFNSSYIREILRSKKLQGRIGVFGLHTYSDLSQDQFKEIVDQVAASPFAGCRLWMTEYGDLEQSGEREWYVAWVMASRLFDLLEGGFNGALVWDAFDNYHDHDAAWTLYGLLRAGLRLYTPKRRYYSAKQVFRYVLPGFEKIKVDWGETSLRLLGFASPDRSQFTLVGMNRSGQDLYINARLEGFSDTLLTGKMDYHRTSESENCVKVERVNVRSADMSFDGLAVHVTPHSIFTLTNVSDRLP